MFLISLQGKQTTTDRNILRVSHNLHGAAAFAGADIVMRSPHFVNPVFHCFFLLLLFCFEGFFFLLFFQHGCVLGPKGRQPREKFNQLQPPVANQLNCWHFSAVPAGKHLFKMQYLLLLLLLFPCYAFSSSFFSFFFFSKSSGSPLGADAIYQVFHSQGKLTVYWILEMFNGTRKE